eukprot:TRINITY_DN5603_c0_g1_i2.p1 TRINITY_DN5603_c0_g1~~TRINITY_DN5603_c0_g1_i2.p1  ORF type:complete len:327 (-),score=54.12 TRINITY_DN5603_c0_g1_i2:1-948(-)
MWRLVPLTNTQRVPMLIQQRAYSQVRTTGDKRAHCEQKYLHFLNGFPETLEGDLGKQQLRWLIIESNRHKLFSQTFELYKLTKGIRMEVDAQTAILKALGSLGRTDQARALFEEISNFESNLVATGIMIDMYSKKKQFTAAEELFEFAKKTWPVAELEVVYCTMMSMYGAAKKFAKVEKLYDSLIQEIAPSPVCYRNLISMFAKELDEKKINLFLSHMRKLGQETDDWMNSTICNMYARLRRPTEALQFYSKIKTPTVAAYNMALGIYAEIGDYKKMDEILEKMEGQGAWRDSSTYMKFWRRWKDKELGEIVLHI